MAIDRLVELARFRNELIPQMLADGTFYTPVNPDKTQESRERFGEFFSGFVVEGSHNLEAVRGLLATNQFIFAGNHIKELDIIARKIALEATGFKHLTDNTVYPVELKWAEDPLLKYWMDADHTVYTIPPNDLRDLDEGLKSEGLYESDLVILRQYKTNCNNLTRAAVAKLGELRRAEDGDGPKILGLYPETDFQRDGYIRRAPAGVSMLFSRHEGEYTVPILTTGPELLTSLTEPMEVSQRPQVRVRVGNRYPSKEVWDKRQKEVVEPVDLVMASIAKLDSSRIHPNFISFYAPLIGS